MTKDKDLECPGCPNCGGVTFTYTETLVTCDDCSYEISWENVGGDGEKAHKGLKELKMTNDKELKCSLCGGEDFFDYETTWENKDVLIHKCNNLDCGCEIILSEKELQKEKLKDPKREQYSFLMDRLAQYSNLWGRPLTMDALFKLVTDFKDTILDTVPRTDIVQYLLESDLTDDKTRD